MTTTPAVTAPPVTTPGGARHATGPGAGARRPGPGGRGGPAFSVVIPAHQEAAVLGATLSAITADLAPGEAEVVVVANGCTDATAEVAAAVPGVRVVVLEESSKTAALDAGDAAVTAFPRVYLDADVPLGTAALRTLAAALDTDAAVAACPAPAFDLSASSWPVRAFYAAFTELPYVRADLVGLGVYGLSAAGRSRFGAFPRVTADDLFVQRLFAPQERLRPGAGLPDDVTFPVAAPRTLASLVAVRRRVAHGNAELAAAADRRAGAGDDGPPAPAGAGTPPAAPPGESAPASTTAATVAALAALAVRRPALAPAAVVYAGVTAWARLRARRPSRGWERDTSTRQAPAAPATAYLVSQYPALSHSFVGTEVERLRAAGVGVRTFSVRPAAAEDLLTPRARADAATTTVLQHRPAGPLVVATLAVLARRPGALATAAATALRTGAPTVRARSRQLLYLGEALLLWYRMDRDGLRHVHVHFANNSADVARLAVGLGRSLDGQDAGWAWSLSMHGPTELEDVVAWDLGAKVASAAWVACISDFCRSQLMRHLPPAAWDRLHVVRMGVDAARFAPAPGESGTDGSAGGPDVAHGAGTTDERGGGAGPLRVLTVGRLVPEKGAPLLLEAVADLLARGVDVELDVVGAGPLEAALRARAARPDLAGRVRLLGPVGQDRLPALYAAADVFALPSFAEGLPVVLMEAMACARAVVTTPIAGIPELVVDGTTGLLVAPGRADALADALATLAGDPPLRERLGAAGRAAVVRRHDPAVGAALLADLLSGSGNHRPGPTAA